MTKSEVDTNGTAQKSLKKEFMCLSNLIKRSLDVSRSERGETVTPMHGKIIGYIRRNDGRDVFQKDIESAFSYRRSTASTVLGLMEEKGLIERHPVPHDARLKRIVLTEKAKLFAKFCEEDAERLDGKMTRGIPDDEMTAFFSVLDKIKDNLKEEKE